MIVTGAAGQDGRFLVPKLLTAGAEVHVVVRSASRVQEVFRGNEVLKRIIVHKADLAETFDPSFLLREIEPDYIFNLAGQSSVSDSFANPSVSWKVNAGWVATLLESIRVHAPETRLYQSSSSEMFGWSEGESVVHNERSSFHPRSPYGASKAAAHMLCAAYRIAFGLRVACGILFNHESKYRGAGYLTSKVAAHVRSLRAHGTTIPPLVVGDFTVKRDWGYAGEFADGILRVAAQTMLRDESDDASAYRDYVLGTGVLTTVRDLVDRAFAIGGFEVDWRMDDSDRTKWVACFRHSDRIAVRADASLFRVSEPPAIQSDPSRATAELGWRATKGVDLFLREMILDADA